jgi:hypothetical protein
MMPLSYRSPKTQVRESKIHGRGIFATTKIAKDETVAVKGGHIVDRKTLREQISPRLGPVEIQIDEDCSSRPSQRKSVRARCFTAIIPAIRISGCAVKSLSWPCDTFALARNSLMIGLLPMTMITRSNANAARPIAEGF